LFWRPDTPKRVWLAAATCAVIPDLDVIGFHFGVPYDSFWGHRGFTHSLVFAALLATLAFFLVCRTAAPTIGFSVLWLYLFLATASHGFLDAMTDGGLGVAFLSPFSNVRYFFPWRPIRVSPIGIARFFTSRSLAVLRSEILWIWLPSFALILIAWLLHLRRTQSRSVSD
jgi:inner membrane protein